MPRGTAFSTTSRPSTKIHISGRAQRVSRSLQDSRINWITKARKVNLLIMQGGIPQKRAAELLGVSPSYVSQLLGLLKLPPEVREAVQEGRLSVRRAHSLGKLPRKEMLRRLAVEGGGPAKTVRSELADLYASVPLKKVSRRKIRESLVAYAQGLDTTDPLRRAEREGVLRGLEIAGGLEN